MADRRSANRQLSDGTDTAVRRLMAGQRPPGRKQLDEESELRRRRRSMAAAAAARAGGALSLTAVLLGAPALALPAAATPTDGMAAALASITSALGSSSVATSDADR